MKTWQTLVLGCLIGLSCGLSACAKSFSPPPLDVAHLVEEERGTTEASASLSDTALLTTTPPPFSEGIYPCSRCHAKLITNPTRRQLRWAHENIVLNHDEKNRWCLDCHNADNRDYLHLAGGALVPFTESYRLCGQCHGEKYRDWRAGEHGKRTGSWSGDKTYRLCPVCHNPHSPRFKPLQPMPPPMTPKDLGANR